ncbi:MAG: hypothetical protein WD356_00540 [Pseudomonadales bacterium]
MRKQGPHPCLRILLSFGVRVRYSRNRSQTIGDSEQRDGIPRQLRLTFLRATALLLYAMQEPVGKIVADRLSRATEQNISGAREGRVSLEPRGVQASLYRLFLIEGYFSRILRLAFKNPAYKTLNLCRGIVEAVANDTSEMRQPACENVFHDVKGTT